MTAGTAGATAQLSTLLHDRARDGLPEAVAQAARDVILDALGCLFAGTGEGPSRLGREYVGSVSGRGESSVVGLPQQVDAASAAFANGIAIHALDFEPIGSPSCHAPASVLPAVLALAEARGMAGRDLLTAFAIGWEVESRLRRAGKLRSAFHPLAIYGPVAAAAACAALLGLDAAGIENAIGIAASSAGGLAANGHTPVKVVHAGSAARAGVLAALQAEQGLTGAPGVFERPGGYGEAFFAEAEWGSLAARPDHYSLTPESVVYKPYPVQLPMLNVIDTVLDVRPPGYDPADLETLELVVPPLVASRSNPRPKGGHAGKFSAEYCAAAALLFGEVGIATFDDDVLSDPPLIAVIDRIRIVERADLAFPAMTARLLGADGSLVEASRADPRGSGAAPLSREQRIAKVRGCLVYAGVGDIEDELVSRVDGLETSDDVSRLGELLRTLA